MPVRCSKLQLSLVVAPLVVLLGAGAHAGTSGHHGHGGQAASGFHGHGMAPAGNHVAAPGGHPHFAGAGPRGATHVAHGGHWSRGMRGGQAVWFFNAQPVAPLLYAPAAVLVQPELLYYCNALQAYYPDVDTCPEPWMLVAPAALASPE